LLCSFFHPPVTSSHFGPNILLNALLSNTLGLFGCLRTGRWGESMPYISNFYHHWPGLYNKRCLQYNNFHSFTSYHARRGHKIYSHQNLRPCRW
jgi:hypothetical protein